jgi:transposase
MHRPYLNAVGAALLHAEVVFDKFHVQHASAALDEVRRQEFFRAGAVMRVGDRTPDSVRPRLDTFPDRSTGVLKSVKTANM